MNIKITLEQNVKLPTKAHETDAAFDIYATSNKNSESGEYKIEPGKAMIIDTGIRTEIPAGYYAAVYVRSGLGIKSQLRPSNCVGIIDSDYRGEWKVALHNDSDEVRVIAPGDRIAQFIIHEVLPVTLEQVNELSDTERGAGGFGSSGK